MPRSWYNRAGVEIVMGFCTKAQHRRFLEVCPEFEKYIVDDGILLVKFWLEVSDEDQKRRFEARINDPLRQWKLSPTDLYSRSRWYEYSRAREERAREDGAQTTGHELLKGAPQRIAGGALHAVGEMVDAEKEQAQPTEETHDGGGIHGLRGSFHRDRDRSGHA